jgi:hypothetical protein
MHDIQAQADQARSQISSESIQAEEKIISEKAKNVLSKDAEEIKKLLDDIWMSSK